MRYLIAFVMLALLPATAQAEWLEAQSTNFVVYADDSEADVRRFSEQLELYHSAMEVITGVDLPPPSPSNRVTVYVVKNEREVQKLFGDSSRLLAGFYLPRAGGSLAVVPSVRVTNGQLDFSMITLLHEYAHHFMISNSSFPSPRWMSEGSAEFFASAKFPRGGGIGIGMPAGHRAGELFYAKDVTAEQLLDPAAYTEVAKGKYDAFYGKSWLLYHYLVFNRDRTGQRDKYLGLLASGKSAREAALEAFGDFEQLDRDLDRYLRQGKMTSMVFQPGQLESEQAVVRRLSEGAAAMMPVRIRSKRGVDEEQAREVLADARNVAARYPQDPEVLSALAEAEYDAGNNAEAIVAADAALALDPNQVNAYVQKGYALFRQAPDAEDLEAAYKEAVEPFLALNKIENDHPLPLLYYYRSFVERGAQPPEIAVLGLERASEMAPFDLDLRMNVAVQQLRDKRFDEARANLIPLAYNPHGGTVADNYRAVVDLLEAGEEDQGVLFAAMSGSAPETEAGGGS